MCYPGIMSDSQDPSAALQQLMQQQSGPSPEAQAEVAKKAALEQEEALKKAKEAALKLKGMEEQVAVKDQARIVQARQEFSQIVANSSINQERQNQASDHQAQEKAALLEERSKSIIQLKRTD